MNQHIVFVGAGGAGVSSLVLLFQTLGFPHIIAIDSTESELTKKLVQAGVHVIIGHGTYTIQQDDIVIYSDAAEHSPEVQAAHAKMLLNKKKVAPVLSYFQFLGELSKYMTTISIAGTHGKSTTTALTATAAHAHHPNFGLGIVGAPVSQWGEQNFILGKDRHQDIQAIIQHILFPKSPDISNSIKKYLFVIEADEYNHHFLHLDTDYACITNIELDHADVYGTFENYLDTFLTFARRVRHNIFVLPDALGIKDFLTTKAHNELNEPPVKGVDSSEHREDLSGGLGSKIIQADNIHFNFTHMLGSHNHANASLALACTTHLLEKKHVRAPREAPLQTASIIKTLEKFKGLRRRGEYLATNKHGISIITDYGHHPSELSSTLLALREKYPDQKLTCIFQPHQARRVMEFREPFTQTLQQFDTTIIYDIYAARENLEDLKQQFGEKFTDINSIDELGFLFAKNSGGIYTTTFSDIQKTLDETSEGVIIIFTAGNLDREIRKYLY